MKILLVTSEPPLPMGHVSARWFWVLANQLANAGHEIELLSSCSKQPQLDEATSRFRKVENVNFYGFIFGKSQGLWGKLQSWWSPGVHQFSAEFRNKFNELSKEADLIHGEQLATALVINKSKHKKKFVNIHHLYGFDRQGEDRTNLKESFVKRRQTKLEKRLIKKMPKFTAVSSELVERINKINKRAEGAWLPFAIDTDLYLPTHEKRAFSFGLVGNMNWTPSYRAAKNILTQVWPEIHRRNPEARLLVAGWNARSALREHIGDPCVIIEENIEDILETFQKIQTLIYFPNRGSGIKVKILEAMLMECSVVTNDTGIEGLSAKPGDDLLVENNLDNFIELALELSSDVEKERKIAKAGRQYVLDNHNGEKSLKVLMDFYFKL